MKKNMNPGCELMWRQLMQCVHTRLWALVVLAALMSGCTGSRMFESTYEQYYREQKRVSRDPVIKLRDDDPSYLTYRHKIRPGDELKVEIMNLPQELQRGNVSLNATLVDQYEGVVTHDGFLYMPLVPRIYVAGKVTDEVSTLVEIELGKLFENPVVTTRVANLKAFCFGFSMGGGMQNAGVGMGANTQNQARVIELESENTGLVEVLATAGGISTVNKIRKVKIIRNYNTDKVQIIWLDCSKLDILKTDIYIHPDDIIYAEMRPVFLFMGTISPYLQAINLGVTMSVLLLNIII